MARYRCVRCEYEFEGTIEGPVRCSQCSFRVLEKVRPEVIKDVLAE